MNSKSAKETEAISMINILNGKVRVKLDTGAEVNVMPKRVYQKLVTDKSISNGGEIQATSTKLTGYEGAEIPVKETCVLPCSYKNQEIETEFYIVETDNRTITSLEAWKQLKLIKVLHSLKTSNEVSGCKPEQIKENYKEVFQGVGKLDESYHMSMDPESVPVAQAPRMIPAMLRSKLKDELDRMEKEQVIVRVEEPTEWVHNHVIVEKPNGKLRSQRA